MKVYSYFQHLVSNENNELLYEEVSLAKLEGASTPFKSGKSQGMMGGWRNFPWPFYMMRKNLLRVIEKVK